MCAGQCAPINPLHGNDLRSRDDQRLDLYPRPHRSTLPGWRTCGLKRLAADVRRSSLQSSRTDACKLSNDPHFVEIVPAFAGLERNTPDTALVVHVEQLRRIQALVPTQQEPPMGSGCVEGNAHDCVRHDTTTQLAALNVATGETTKRSARRLFHQVFLRLPQQIDASAPRNRDVQLLEDCASTRRNPKAKE